MTPETPFLANEIAAIREIQEDHTSLLSLLLEQQRPLLVDGIISDHFGKKKRRALVYLEVEAGRSTAEIARRTGISTSNVSRELTELRRARLVERSSDGSYRHRLERFLGLAPALKRRFGL